VVMKNFIFWDRMLYSPLKINRHFGRTCHLHCFSETSLNFQRVIQSYIPEDIALQSGGYFVPFSSGSSIFSEESDATSRDLRGKEWWCTVRLFGTNSLKEGAV
jgi:hypothetical protein